MFDIKTTFGTADTLSTGTAKDFPYGIDMNDGEMGLQEDLFCNFYLQGRALTASDKVSFSLLDSSATGAGTEIATYTAPQADYEIGHCFSVKLPRKHQRYITAKVTVTGTTLTSMAFEGYLERG